MAIPVSAEGRIDLTQDDELRLGLGSIQGSAGQAGVNSLILQEHAGDEQGIPVQNYPAGQNNNNN